VTNLFVAARCLWSLYT